MYQFFLFFVVAQITLASAIIPPQNTFAADASLAAGRCKLVGRFICEREPPKPRSLDIYGKVTKDFAPLTNDGRTSPANLWYQKFLVAGIRPKLDPLAVANGPGDGIHDVFVWVTSRDIPWTNPKDFPPLTITINDGQAAPRTAVVMAGQSIVVENQDPIPSWFWGHAFKNQPFNELIQPQATWAKVFHEPENMPMGIDVNFFNQSVLMVHSNPYSAITDDNGNWSIADLPQGTWSLRAWHYRMGWLKCYPKEQFTVTVTEGTTDLGSVKVSGTDFH